MLDSHCMKIGDTKYDTWNEDTITRKGASSSRLICSTYFSRIVKLDVNICLPFGKFCPKYARETLKCHKTLSLCLTR